MKVNTGIAESARSEIAEGLSRLPADTYTLYLKTHGYHWNVTGPMIQSARCAARTERPDAAAMVERLVEGHEAVIGTAREVVKTAEAADDVATADLATQRINTHEKAA